MWHLRRHRPQSEWSAMRPAPAMFGSTASGIGAGATSGCRDIGDGGPTRTRFGCPAEPTMSTAATPIAAATGVRVEPPFAPTEGCAGLGWRALSLCFEIAHSVLDR